MVHVHRFADGTRKFVGLLAGNVVLSPEDSQWIGAQHLDNISAELTAMAVAYTFAISLQQPCCICPDLRFGHDLIRRQVTNKDNLIVARLCTALGRLHHVPIEEVRAHRGDPYNELADRTAKWVGVHGLSLGSFDWSPLRGLASSARDIDWAWICSSGPHIKQMLPVIDDVGSLQIRPADNRISCPELPSNPAPGMLSLLFSLRVATANVQSAREKSSGVGTRSAALTKRFDRCQQWHQHPLDIVGVQEARTPQGQDVSSHYAIYCSGVDVSSGSAHFGCEIWLRKDAIIAQGAVSICLGACKVVVHIADPRRLVLVVSHGSFEFVIVSLHAPCLSTLSSLDDIAAWWNDTSRILQPLPLDRCIAFVDANASLGVDAMPLVGSHGAEPESAQSLLFHEFLEATQLMVPCTFEHCHEGESSTWKHPKGSMCRRDYVLLALSLQSWAVRSFVLTDFDRARAHVDHLPSVLCLHGCLQGYTGPPKMAWDDNKLRDPDRCAQFREALATLPIPHWTVSADDHCALWEMQVLQLAKSFFAKSPDDPKPRRRPVLTAPTLALIQFKRHVLSLARSTAGLEYEEYKAVLRDVEKQVRGMVARDQRAWYDDLICQVQASGELHDSAHMFRLLRRLGSRKYKPPRRPLPMLLKPDGSHTTSVPEMQEVFRSQFAEIEGGVLTTLEALAADHHQHELLPAESIDLSLLIGPWDIAQVLPR